MAQPLRCISLEKSRVLTRDIYLNNKQLPLESSAIVGLFVSFHYFPYPDRSIYQIPSKQNYGKEGMIIEYQRHIFPLV